MQLFVLLGLAALWVAVLLPDFLRRRTTRRSGDSISSFSRHLSVLERSHVRTTSTTSNVVRLAARQTPMRPTVPSVGRSLSQPARRPVHAAPAGPAPTPARSSWAQRRRQDVIVSLLAASLLTFLATVTFSGLFLYLHLLVDLALVAYVAAVLSLTRRQAARSRVSYLPGTATRSAMSSNLLPVPARRSSVAR